MTSVGQLLLNGRGFGDSYFVTTSFFEIEAVKFDVNSPNCANKNTQISLSKSYVQLFGNTTNTKSKIF